MGNKRQLCPKLGNGGPLQHHSHLQGVNSLSTLGSGDSREVGRFSRHPALEVYFGRCLRSRQPKLGRDPFDTMRRVDILDQNDLVA